jgi:hypothetical protein
MGRSVVFDLLLSDLFTRIPGVNQYMYASNAPAFTFVLIFMALLLSIFFGYLLKNRAGA